MRAPYRPRVVVRASEAAAWTGAVVVEWLNVSGGVDAVAEWASTYRHAGATRRALHSADSGHHPSTWPSRRRRFGRSVSCSAPRKPFSPTRLAQLYPVTGRIPAAVHRRHRRDDQSRLPAPPRSRPLLAFAEPSRIPG